MVTKAEEYDWAQALVSLVSNNSGDFNELAAAAQLDPRAGDLADVDLSDLDLSGQNLAGWDLRNANLRNARLDGTELRKATVDPWELVQATDWEQAHLDDDLREIASTLNPAFTRPVAELEFSVRTANCLRDIGLIGDLVEKTEAEVLRLPNFGRKSLNEVKEVLAQMGIHLGMELKGWPPNRVRARRQLTYVHRDFVETDWQVEREREKSQAEYEGQRLSREVEAGRLEERALLFNPALLKKVQELEFSVRTANCLKNDSTVYIGDLVQKTEAEILRMPNMGRKGLNEIKEVLAQFGLHLGMEVSGWPPESVEELARNFEDHY